MLRRENGDEQIGFCDCGAPLFWYRLEPVGRRVVCCTGGSKCSGSAAKTAKVQRAKLDDGGAS